MKILVLRFSSIGDIVLTTPVLRGLREQAGAEVHVLCKKPFASVLDGSFDVDAAIESLLTRPFRAES